MFMQKPTLRRNGSKEVTFKISYHLDLRTLAIVVLDAFGGNCDVEFKSQQQFEEKVRHFLFAYGTGSEDFLYRYSEEETNIVMMKIKQLYPNHNWE